MIFKWAVSIYEGHWKGGGLEILSFWAQMAHASLIAISGPPSPPPPIPMTLINGYLSRGSCFFGYTAENSHHLKARIISNIISVFTGENTSKKMGQMSSNFGEIIKKLLSVFGEKPPEGYPSHPQHTAPGFSCLDTWRKR